MVESEATGWSSGPHRTKTWSSSGAVREECSAVEPAVADDAFAAWSPLGSWPANRLTNGRIAAAEIWEKMYRDAILAMYPLPYILRS